MLHRTEEGEGRELVVLVHGFTQTLASWDEVAPLLAGRDVRATQAGRGVRATQAGRGRYRVRRVDLPGHGGSSSLRLGFADAAAAVGEAGGRASYVGYSMGGRLCLRLALERPDLVTALVLVGASPGLAEAGERAARRGADGSLADEIEAAGTGAFLERWLAQPLFDTLRPAPHDLAARRANRPEDLAAALRLLGTGTQDPAWHRLRELGMPTLLVAGENDARYVDLATRMAEAIGPSARVALVAGAGHAAHLEQPGRFVAILERFLDDTGHAS